MLNSQLRTAISDVEPEASIIIINPGTDETDHERFGIGKVTYLTGVSPADTIIEASREPGSMPAGDFRAALEEQDANGDVQVYVEGWEGQGFAYFDIARVRRIHVGAADIILGAWRCGG
jgi:hypothetical protein